MNEQQYRSLCEVCDRVLLAPDSTIEQVAISWLHVIREHPAFLANYVDLFESAIGGRAIARKLWRFFRSRAVSFLQLLRALRADGKLWFGPEELPRGVDVLFVSHLLNPSQAGQADDFYFGGLPNELVARGHSAVIVLINHTGKDDAEPLVRKWKGYLLPHVILSNSLMFVEEVALLRRLKKESFRLRRLAKKETPGLLRRVIYRASEEVLVGASLTNLRMASQFDALAAKLQPKAIIVTHEGYAWERLAFAAARGVNPNVRCVGYQHAAVFRLQHAIMRHLAPEYNPDQILTAGSVGKEQLARALGMNSIPISVLGSNRTFKGNTINSVNSIHLDLEKQCDNSACLVMPEGFASECRILFEFSLACAESFPKIQFIWRLHPIVTHESLAAQNPRLRHLPKNVELSQSTLDDDIARCRCALYRGTTAIVPAVVAGLRPIYLQLPGEMTFDPLYELEGWRLVIRTAEEFIQAIHLDSGDKNGALKKIQEEAYTYCKRFYEPFNVYELVKALFFHEQEIKAVNYKNIPG